MYKKQMTFQRIVCMLMLIACVIVFVYSLGLVTDLHESLRTAISNPKKLDKADITGARIVYDIQPFNRSFTMYAVILIIVNLLPFIMGTNSRRKYYIGNYVSIGVITIANVAMTVWALPQIMDFRGRFLNVNFEEMKVYSEMMKTPYTESTFWFDAGFVVLGILMLMTVLMLVNLVLKIIVMKEEKRLIGSRKDGRA